MLRALGLSISFMSFWIDSLVKEDGSTVPMYLDPFSVKIRLFPAQTSTNHCLRSKPRFFKNPASVFVLPENDCTSLRNGHSIPIATSLAIVWTIIWSLGLS